MKISELITLDNDEFLREAYCLVLGREVDRAGIEHYTRKLNQGMSKEAMLVSLARSEEAQARFALGTSPELTDEAFIDATYVRLLGRHADPDGMRVYSRRLEKKGDRAQVVRDIANSQEARHHDPLGWIFRNELNQLVRRETSFLGWRKLIKPSKIASVAYGKGEFDEKFELFAKEILQMQRAESVALRDQVIMIANALEGISRAQKQISGRTQVN